MAEIAIGKHHALQAPTLSFILCRMVVRVYQNDKECCGAVRKGGASAPPLEFVHFGLTAKYQLTTALARLRERGDREAVGEGFADLERRKQPLTPGFAVPSPLGEGRYQTAAPM